MLLPLFYSLLGLTAAVFQCAAQVFAPAAIPIAARSPYLLNFLTAKPSAKLSRTWQTGYSNQVRPALLHNYRALTSSQVQAWAGLIRVDNMTYAWAGDIDTMPKGIQDPQLIGSSPSLTPTSSVFTYQAGPVQLKATFLSPIEVSLDHSR